MAPIINPYRKAGSKQASNANKVSNFTTFGVVSSKERNSTDLRHGDFASSKLLNVVSSDADPKGSMHSKTKPLNSLAPSTVSVSVTPPRDQSNLHNRKQKLSSITVREQNKIPSKKKSSVPSSFKAQLKKEIAQLKRKKAEAKRRREKEFEEKQNELKKKEREKILEEKRKRFQIQKQQAEEQKLLAKQAKRDAKAAQLRLALEKRYAKAKDRLDHKEISEKKRDEAREQKRKEKEEEKERKRKEVQEILLDVARRKNEIEQKHALINNNCQSSENKIPSDRNPNDLNHTKVLSLPYSSQIATGPGISVASKKSDIPPHTILALPSAPAVLAPISPYNSTPPKASVVKPSPCHPRIEKSDTTLQSIAPQDFALEKWNQASPLYQPNIYNDNQLQRIPSWYNQPLPALYSKFNNLQSTNQSFTNYNKYFLNNNHSILTKSLQPANVPPQMPPSFSMPNRWPYVALNAQLSLSNSCNNPTLLKNDISHKVGCNPSKRSNETKPRTMILNERPIDAPSPFSKSHEILTYDIIIFKEGHNSTFGIDVRYDSRGTFITRSQDDVEDFEGESNRSELKMLKSTINDGTLCLEKGGHDNKTSEQNLESSNSSTSPVPLTKSDVLTNGSIQNGLCSRSSSVGCDIMMKANKKPKKIRVTYGVMSIVNAEKHNQSTKMNTGKKRPSSKLLQTGDIVLSINGKSVGGMDFREAVKLFTSSCVEERSESTIEGNNSDKRTLTPATSFCQPPEEEKVKEDITESPNKILCTLEIARDRKNISLLQKLDQLSRPIDAATFNRRKKRKSQATDSQNSRKPKVEGSNNDLANKMTTSSSKLISPHSQNDSSEIDLKLNHSTGTVESGEFNRVELRGLICGVMCLQEEINAPPSNMNLFEKILNHEVYGKSLVRRNTTSLEIKWYLLMKSMDERISKTSETRWKYAWKKEIEDFPENSDESIVRTEFISDYQRAILRCMPKSPSGCRCGSSSHEYVYDPNCFLYRDMRKMASASLVQKLESNDAVDTKKGKYADKLTQIGNAYLDRIKRREKEKKAIELEVLFIGEMEKIQVSRLKMAIKSPYIFAVLVISTIAHFQFEQSHKLALHDKESGINLNGIHQPCSKLSSYFLALMIQYISKTWGHVYVEKDDLDFSWNYECYREINQMESKYKFSKNPRSPGQPSFEGLHLILDKSILERLQKSHRLSLSTQIENNSKTEPFDSIEDHALITHLVSDAKTGLIREIYELYHIGVIEINSNGIASLNVGWEKKIHPIILQDMWLSGWENDSDGKFCIHPSLRKTLKDHWIRQPHGWARRDNPSKIIHSHEDYETRKLLYTEKFESFANEVDGIAHFGI